MSPEKNKVQTRFQAKISDVFTTLISDELVRLYVQSYVFFFLEQLEKSGQHS